MTKHDLKILPEYFEAILDGTKTDELRQEDDRMYAVGDVLVLHEWQRPYTNLIQALKDYRNAHPEVSLLEAREAIDLPGYTGRAVTVEVTYVLRDYNRHWLQPGVAALSIRKVEA